MLDPQSTKEWVLTVTEEALLRLAELGDDVTHGVHVDGYDDSPANSPGRVFSFELDAKGKLEWWAWRTEGVCARAEWPLKLVVALGEGEHRVIWAHQQKWLLDKADARPRVIRM
jgi:hypothetical protein